MKDLEKKELELKAKFEIEKKEAVKEEQIVAEHTQKLHAHLQALKDLQAQFRLIQELKAKK